MRLRKIHLLLLTPFMLAGLSGCSQNEGRSGREAFTPDYDAEPAGTYSGQVLDGYLNGAVVWIDLNNNRLQDDGEPVTETSARGRFTFTKEQLCAEGGSVCVTRPNAYPLGVEVIAGKTVDEYAGTTVDRTYYLWAPPIPRHMVRVVTPFTTLLKAERDLQGYTGQQLVYPRYTPPTEAELAAELDQIHQAVRNKLGVYQNLLVDYLSSSNARLHAYARGLVWAMQDYVESQGGSLPVKEGSNPDDDNSTPDDPMETLIRQAYQQSAPVMIQVMRLMVATGLSESEITEILQDKDLDDEGKIKTLAARVLKIQPKMDGLGRALVNQGRWVVQAIEAAVGANAPASAYDAIPLADVVPPIYVLDQDPKVVSRKKFYVHPNSVTGGATPFTGLMTMPSVKEPIIAGAAITQVQDYLYDLDGHLAQIDVYGDLQEWRRDLLLSYPSQLEALFPRERWQARSLKLNALGTPSWRIAIDRVVNGTQRTATISVHKAVDGVFGPSADEPEWTQVREAHTDMTADHLLRPALLSQSWLKSSARRDFGRLEEILQETYPAVPTLLDNLGAPEEKVPTGLDTDVVLSHTPANHTGNVTQLDFAYSSSQAPRSMSFSQPSANRMDVDYKYQAGGEVSWAKAVVSLNMWDSPTSILYLFQSNNTGTAFQDYCVQYRYNQYDVLYEIYGRASNQQCMNNMPFLVVEYEYAHLSEVLKR